MHVVIASLGFPAWLRVTHFINLLFIGLLIRSGLQILGAHPRLYWNDGCNPDYGTARGDRETGALPGFRFCRVCDGCHLHH